MRERLFIVGPGRAGLSLGYALWQSGSVEALTFCGRGQDPPAHPLFINGFARYVFGLERPEKGATAAILAVPDHALPAVAVALAGHGEAPPGCAAFHLSGALGTDALAPLLERGYSIGTIHPLQTLADPVLGAEQLKEIYFAISGEPAAMAAANRILNPLGASVVKIPVSRRPLYHAAAVLASNYLGVLVSVAARVMARAGMPEEEALAAILPLARGSLENLGRLGPVGALTGPVSRGDVETVRLHLRALEPGERALYASLGTEVLRVAEEAGLEEATREELRTLFERER